MVDIGGNFSTFDKFKHNENKIESETKQIQHAPVNTAVVSDTFAKERRKNTGLIERLYNKIKNVTGVGIGTKKVDKTIADLQNGKVTQEQAEKTIHDYSSSQETSAQLLGDGASVAAGAGVFFGLGKKIKMINSIIKINDTEKLLKELPKQIKIFAQPIESILKSKAKTGALVVGLSALSAGFAKYWTLKLNRIGSEEYKLDKDVYGKKKDRTPQQKLEAKAAKKVLKKERRKTNFKNFISGMINGAMLPLMSLGGFIGAPLYVIGNSLNRYFVANKTDKKKSIKGYTDNLKNDAVTTGLTAAAVAVPLAMKGNYTKVFNKNLEKATEKLMKAELKAPDYAGCSAFQELQNTLLGSKEISSIIHNHRLSPEEQITKLTEENIFAVKFKQISSDGSTLTRALRESCPPTRTIEETQELVNSTLGNGYTIKKLLGVGTVAETYLAKTSEGKDVCIKMLKKGITEEKIQKDKQKFIELVKNMQGKTPEEKDYLLRNIDDLADGISKEIDLKNEMEAAQKLVPYTKVANVVKPIEVKNGMYIMEKADGISLASLVDLNEAKLYKEMLEKDSMFASMMSPRYGSKLYRALEGKSTDAEKIQAIQDYIKKIESQTPEFGDITLTDADAKYLINEYMKVLTEQFYKVDKNGKVLHADIHPGNIFIDINAVRARKGKVFTLIDTGNTVNQTMEQSINAINLTSYVNNANVPDIAEYVLEGASLPKGMTKEEALQKVTKELEKCFFDTETSLDKMTNEKVLTLTSNIMQKYRIIPSDTQLNFNKARQSAENSRRDLVETLLNMKVKDLSMNPVAIATFTTSVGKDMMNLSRKYNRMQAAQEKLNLRQMSLPQRLKQRNNPNMKASNSEDYLTYKLKQWKDNLPKF